MIALLAALALVGPPSQPVPDAAKPANGGFPDHDPRRETRILGRVRPGDAAAIPKATTSGEWSDADGRLVPRFASPPREQMWFPRGNAAHLGEGMVRARIELHGPLDLSLLVRQRYQGDPPAVLSGYGLTIEGESARLHRWDRGMPLPMGPEVKLGKLDRRASLELVVFMVGPQLVANIYDGDSLQLVATLAIHDTTYSFGCVGVRVGPKHAASSAVTLLTTMDATKHASRTHAVPRSPRYGPATHPDATPFGNTRYAFIASKATARLPKDLRARVQSTIDSPEGARAVLFLDTVGYERLRRSGVDVLAVDSNVPWSTFDPDFRRRAQGEPRRVGRGFVLDDSYKDPALVEQLLRAYHERYPAITELVDLGKTHQGRTLWALKISDAAARPEDEPAVLLDGAHHGSELLSIEYVLDAIDTLVGGYHHDPRVTRWIDHLEIWCVPLVNPDGNHMFIHESRFAIRKNGKDADGDGYADPFEGVDLNRNYPFGWGESGSSGLPMHKWYRGPSAGSEPETRAMMALADREHFAAAISFHTFGTEIYSSYVVGDATDLKPDVSRAIAKEIVAAAGVQPNDRRYAVRSPDYPVAGSDQDWHTHAHGTMAFVLEGSHHNPPLDIRTQAVIATRPIWMALFDRVLDGPWIGGHVRDAAGKPVAARVMVEEIVTGAGERWTSRARDGRFDRAVTKPGRYTLVVEAEGRAPIERSVSVGRRRVDVDVVLP